MARKENKIIPRLMRGLDDHLYLVFNNAYECEDYQVEHPEFHELTVACFGNYDNALLLVPPEFPNTVGHA